MDHTSTAADCQAPDDVLGSPTLSGAVSPGSGVVIRGHDLADIVWFDADGSAGALHPYRGPTRRQPARTAATRPEKPGSSAAT